MIHRFGEADWGGSFKNGVGRVRTESDALDANFGMDSRFGGGRGTNSEELVGAAHSSCYSMALAKVLSDAGYHPESIHARADVTLSPEDSSIPSVRLRVEAYVPGIEDTEFQKLAGKANEESPISKLVGSFAEIKLEAELFSKPDQMVAYG